MTRVILSPCIGVKSGECLDVCPVDCIHPMRDEPDFATAEQLFINPNECIDCGLCETVCPVTAIFPDDAREVKEESPEFVEKNATYFKRA